MGKAMLFSELKCKEVINCKNCKRLGFVVDIEIDICTGRIKTLIVPGPGKFFGCFGRTNEFWIDFCQVKKIGPDIILVEIEEEKCIHKCQDGI